MKVIVKRVVVGTLPLSVRRWLAVWLDGQAWIRPENRRYWGTQLLVDFAKNDVNAYHKFLWTHHLAYANTYEIDQRFGYEKFNESRKILFGELGRRLETLGIEPYRDINSVLDVGCSLGYLLRYIETDVFPNAASLIGIDVDSQAIDNGSAYLKELGSRIQLYNCDLERIDSVLGDQHFDVVLATGVLLYFDEQSAQRVVASLVSRTERLLIISGLANPDRDNRELDESRVRETDGTWIHNIDVMIESAGATVAARRWDGERVVDGNTIYFLYALPPVAEAQAAC